VFSGARAEIFAQLLNLGTCDSLRFPSLWNRPWLRLRVACVGRWVVDRFPGGYVVRFVCGDVRREIGQGGGPPVWRFFLRIIKVPVQVQRLGLKLRHVERIAIWKMRNQRLTSSAATPLGRVEKNCEQVVADRHNSADDLGKYVCSHDPPPYSLPCQHGIESDGGRKEQSSCHS
jgi:hypothetical protein